MALSRTLKETDYSYFIKECFEEAAKGLPLIECRRVLGCDAYFANGSLFGILWTDGRIGLRLDQADLWKQTMALPQSQVWRPGSGHPVPHWVLLGLAATQNAALLKEWVEKAYHLAYNIRIPEEQSERIKEIKKEKELSNREEYLRHATVYPNRVAGKKV